MEPWHLVIAVLAVILTALGMVGGGIIFLWRAAGYVTRIELVGERVAKIEQRLDRIPQLEQVQALNDSRIKVHDQQIDNLWRKVFSHDKRIAVVRAEMGSQHDTDPPEAA